MLQQRIDHRPADQAIDHPGLIEGTPAPQVPQGAALAEADRNGASLPVSALVDQLYAEVQKMGGSRWDTSSLIARLNSK